MKIDIELLHKERKQKEILQEKLLKSATQD